MNMPGFNAEASLYRTRRHYQMAGNLTQTDAAIYPARFNFSAYRLKDILTYTFLGLGLWRRAYSCCLDCRADMYRICVPLHGVDICKVLYRSTCSPRCDAYWLGGCDKLAPF